MEDCAINRFTGKAIKLWRERSQWLTWKRRTTPWTNAEIAEFLAVVQNTPAWMALRKKGIGASTLGGLIGVNPEHVVPKWAIRSILGCLNTDPLLNDPNWGNEATEMGHKMEPVIAWMVSKITGIEFYEVGIVASNRWPNIIISPDRVSRNRRCRLLEIKLQLYLVLMKPSGQYMCQVQAQMQSLDVTECFLACFCPRDNGRLVVFRVQRCDEFWHDFVLPRLGQVMNALERHDVNFEPRWDAREAERMLARCQWTVEFQGYVSLRELHVACFATGVDIFPEYKYWTAEYLEGTVKQDVDWPRICFHDRERWREGRRRRMALAHQGLRHRRRRIARPYPKKSAMGTHSRTRVPSELADSASLTAHISKASLADNDDDDSGRQETSQEEDGQRTRTRGRVDLLDVQPEHQGTERVHEHVHRHEGGPQV